MNGKKKTIILIALFAILMIGASVLYNSLLKNYKPDSLIVENTSSSKNNNNTDTMTSKEESNHTDSTTSKEDNNTNSTTSKEDNNNSTASKEDNTNSTTSKKENKTSTMTAPDFTVYDLEGNQVHLSDFIGKPIILNFWASWCGPCKMEMPDFNAAYMNYEDKIEFLMINMTDGSRETLETASSFIEEAGYTFPVYFDTDYDAAITYSASSLPTTYFIDSEGTLIAHAKGAIDADTLQKGIDMIYTTK